MKVSTLSTTLLFFCSKVSYSASSFIQHRDLRSNTLSTRIANPILNRVISTDLMSFESMQSIVSHAMAIPQNPNLEAGVFRNLAHATLDIATLFPLSPIVLRLFIFVGRLFVIASDYLPDHYMTPDEVIFQLSMLLLSSRTLYDDAIKLISISTKSISFQDRKIYLIAFLPVGFSWMQYKSLIYDALEWVELSPDQCLLEDGDPLFLTYRGDVYYDADGSNNIQRYGPRDLTRVLDMVGDLSLAKELIDSKCRRKRMTKYMNSATKKGIGEQQSYCKLRAGSDGSLLLRIDINKLIDRVNGDESSLRSIKSLVSNAIERRLIVSLDERQNERFSYNQSQYSEIL